MKRIPILLVAATCILIAACSKDSYETKPTIKIKDYNTREVVQNQTLTITLEYFDKEGDLGQGWVYGILDRQNVNPSNIPNATELMVPLPKFPDRDHGEIEFRIAYRSLEHTSYENDTFLIRVFVADRDANFSDTLTTEQIVSIRP